MILAVPAATPVTMPPATLAVPEALLVQAPPPTELVIVTVLPIHTAVEEGESAAGVTATVIVLTAEQPEAFV